MSAGPRRAIHERGCMCPTCFPLDGETVSLSLADWATVRAVIEGKAENLSGDEFDVTHKDGEVFVTLASERGWTDSGQLWAWREEAGTSG